MRKYPDISGKEIVIMGVIKGVMYKALMRPASEINGKPQKTLVRKTKWGTICTPPVDILKIAYIE